jgi:hypothetical protein
MGRRDQQPDADEILPPAWYACYWRSAALFPAPRRAAPGPGERAPTLDQTPPGPFRGGSPNDVCAGRQRAQASRLVRWSRLLLTGSTADSRSEHRREGGGSLPTVLLRLGIGLIQGRARAGPVQLSTLASTASRQGALAFADRSARAGRWRPWTLAPARTLVARPGEQALRLDAEPPPARPRGSSPPRATRASTPCNDFTVGGGWGGQVALTFPHSNTHTVAPGPSPVRGQLAFTPCHRANNERGGVRPPARQQRTITRLPPGERACSPGATHLGGTSSERQPRQGQTQTQLAPSFRQPAHAF